MRRIWLYRAAMTLNDAVVSFFLLLAAERPRHVHVPVERLMCQVA